MTSVFLFFLQRKKNFLKKLKKSKTKKNLACLFVVSEKKKFKKILNNAREDTFLRLVPSASQLGLKPSG